jgi:16S rRNA (guanine(966)-N(2))-methyltransferase RsmD
VSEIRLAGGRFRGRRLRVPHGVRPSEGRVREALFSIWQKELAGSRFLDLFAGSGAVGLEALGRGAAAVVLVEGDPRVHRTVEENAKTLGASPALRAYRMRLPAGLAVLRGRELPFDLVFADPPYGFDRLAALLEGAADLLAGGGSLCLEHSARDPLPTPPDVLEAEGTRTYGESCLSFYRRRAPGAAIPPADG